MSRRDTLVVAMLLAAVGTIVDGAVATAMSSVTPTFQASAQSSAAVGWIHYANARFGFSTPRPRSFAPQTPPADGDGQSWSSSSGRVLLSAYGQNNVLHYTPSQDADNWRSAIRIKHREIRGRTVTVRGYAHHGHWIVFVHDVVGPGSIDTLYWRYPRNQRAQWADAVSYTVHHYHAGDVSDGH